MALLIDANAVGMNIRVALNGVDLPPRAGIQIPWVKSNDGAGAAIATIVKLNVRNCGTVSIFGLCIHSLPFDFSLSSSLIRIPPCGDKPTGLC
jgi:hypothetical protein